MLEKDLESMEDGDVLKRYRLNMAFGVTLEVREDDLSPKHVRLFIGSNPCGSIRSVRVDGGEVVAYTVAGKYYRTLDEAAKRVMELVAGYLSYQLRTGSQGGELVSRAFRVAEYNNQPFDFEIVEE